MENQILSPIAIFIIQTLTGIIMVVLGLYMKSVAGAIQKNDEKVEALEKRINIEVKEIYSHSDSKHTELRQEISGLRRELVDSAQKTQNLIMQLINKK